MYIFLSLWFGCGGAFFGDDLLAKTLAGTVPVELAIRLRDFRRSGRPKCRFLALTDNKRREQTN